LMFVAAEKGWWDSACSDFPDQPGCVVPDWYDAILTSLAALVGSTALVVVARSTICKVFPGRRARTG